MLDQLPYGRVMISRPPLARVCPIRQVSVMDPAEDLIELGFADQERVVLRMGRAMVVGEVEGHVVAELHDKERPVRGRLLQPEEVDQELRELLLVAYSDDGVVQPNGHRNFLGTRGAPRAGFPSIGTEVTRLWTAYGLPCPIVS